MRFKNRNALTNDLIVSVDPNNGDDCDNWGLTSFKTMQSAWNWVYYDLDLAGFGVTFKLANGIHAPVVCSFPPLGLNTEGKSMVRFEGETLNGAIVQSADANGCFLCSANSEIYIRNLTLRSTGLAPCLNAQYYGLIGFENIVFGPSANSHMRAEQFSMINGFGSIYYVSVGAPAHIVSAAYSEVLINAQNCILQNTPAFDTFAIADHGKIMWLTQANGPATGIQFRATNQSSIYGQPLPGHLPGSVDTTSSIQ